MEQVVVEGCLDRYCLTVYEGDIVCVQSFFQNSLWALMEILSGKRGPERGQLYMDEREVKDFGIAEAKRDGVYVVTFGMEFVEQMTIAENLKRMETPFRLYSVRKNEEKVRDYFRREGVELDPRMPVWKLTDGERRKMGLLRAKLFGARLVILDLSRIQLEGKTAEEICEMVRKMNGEGMTFLILSSKYTPIARVANRIQYLESGRDVKEWREPDEALSEQIRSGDLFFHRTRNGPGKSGGLFVGLYDYEWEISGGIWSYLERVRRDSPEIWEKHIGIRIPREGEVCLDGTVIIPRNSGALLLENLSVGENLTIAAGRRIAQGRYGMIHPRLQKRLVEDYYRRQGLKRDLRQVGELTRVQRKILSVERWALTRPEAIFLELPYMEMNSEEITEFSRYLSSLYERGIRILYLSKSMETITGDCRLVIQTVNGTGAKIDTVSQFFPPPGRRRN